MKVSREARIGILVTISLIIFFTGFYFLKGIDLFSDDSIYYCYYDSVDGLIPAAAIEVRGLNVGHIVSLRLDGNDKVKVTLSVHKRIVLTQGTVAVAVSDGLLMGTKMIRLDLGNSSEVIKPGSVLPVSDVPGLMDNISDQMTPLIKSVRSTVASLDTVIAGINILAGTENRNAITASLKSISLASDNIATLTTSLNKESGELNQILHNTNSFTGTLAQNNDTIKHLLSNLNMVSAQLANSPLQKTVSELKDMSEQMKSIMTKINDGQGSLGQMVNDKNLYNNLNKTLTTTEKLLKDVNEHPKKYVNVTIFGKKKVKD